jgi:hypothetical protein
MLDTHPGFQLGSDGRGSQYLLSLATAGEDSTIADQTGPILQRAILLKAVKPKWKFPVKLL